MIFCSSVEDMLLSVGGVVGFGCMDRYKCCWREEVVDEGRQVWWKCFGYVGASVRVKDSSRGVGTVGRAWCLGHGPFPQFAPASLAIEANNLHASGCFLL